MAGTTRSSSKKNAKSPAKKSRDTKIDPPSQKETATKTKTSRDKKKAAVTKKAVAKKQKVDVAEDFHAEGGEMTVDKKGIMQKEMTKPKVQIEACKQ